MVTLAIVHSISLPPGEYGGPGIEDLFRNRLNCDAHPCYDALRGLRVSAHFVVRRDGGVLQFVSTRRRAWHAGASSWRGRDDCNSWSVGIELEGLEGAAFEPAQYVALTRLLRALRRRHPVHEVVGHEHVAPGRKGDPGSGFLWHRLREDLRCRRIVLSPLDPEAARPGAANRPLRQQTSGSRRPGRTAPRAPR